LYYTKQRTLQVGKKWTESVKVKQRYGIATESGMLSVLAELSNDHAELLNEFEAKVGTSGVRSSGTKEMINEGATAQRRPRTTCVGCKKRTMQPRD
jgi:hypothetical protein